MIKTDVMGLIFANVHDDLVGELASARSMASVPFGGRYRLIDFPLSCMVNAGISNVGVIPKSNYHSLLDHLGSGKAWDLDRKSGGLTILPPDVNSNISLSSNHIESIDAVRGFLARSKEEYVVLCDADFVGNVNIGEMLEHHLKTGADVTFSYKTGSMPRNNRDTMALEMDADNRVCQIKMIAQSGTNCNYSLNIVVIKRRLLMKLTDEAMVYSQTNLWRDVFQAKAASLKIYGYAVKDEVWVIDSRETYAAANFSLLKPEVRNNLFRLDRPVYTKIRDDVPTRYGLNSRVSNSLIADGCLIEGTVKNCVIFRGATIGAGTVVENCIIMQDCVIGHNAALSYLILDKNVTVSDETKMRGAASLMTFVGKNAVV